MAMNYSSNNNDTFLCLKDHNNNKEKKREREIKNTASIVNDLVENIFTFNHHI